ncbi:transposon Ty3-I Gag-Pol polyprotein, partial [Nephila pilipes]
MVALRGEIAALSKQVERLSRDRSRNRSRTRYGHLVTQQGTKPLPDKVEPILNYPKPKTIKELQRFLGILNFFRRFLPNVAQHQIALSEFLKGTRKNDNRVIEWTTQAEQDFCTCKKLIADATLLAHPKPDAELILHVDSSDFAIGGHENITADSLSRIASIEMPNPINYDEIAKSQESDLELQNLINNPQGLQLRKIVMPNSDIPLFCDLSTGTARPYIPKDYRQRIFSQLHNMSHP